MFQPLYVAATGLEAMEENVLDIVNNISNSETVGFKQGRTEMESLPYVQKSFKDELTNAINSLDEAQAVIPEFGTGVRIAATPKDFTQGSLKTTSNPLDLAIQGNGFFQVIMPDRSMAYTRAGNFHVDNEGNIVDINGHILEPSITVPEGTTAIIISQDGTVYVSTGNSIQQSEIGKITLANFQNPEGLRSMGQNLFAKTEMSGDPITGDANDAGFGYISQYSLESSNVEIISEMMRMVMAQRIFDTITKSVETYEGMLKSVQAMKA